jgi:hypothetical protein
MLKFQVPAVIARTLSITLYVLCASTAFAADWEWNPRVAVGGTYNDNLNFASVSADRLSLFGTNLDAQVELVVDGPRTQFKFTPELQENYYPGHTYEDSNNELLSLFFQEQGLTYNAGIYGNWASRLLVYTGLPSTTIVGDLGQPQQQQGSVLTTSGFRQDLLNLSPYFNLQLTPRTHLQLTAGFVDSTFNVQQIDYINSTNLGGSAGIAYDVTPTASLSVAGTASRFEPSTGFASNTYGVQAEWDGHFSPTQQYYIRLGGDRTFISLPAGAVSGDAISGLIAGAGVHWSLQVTEVFLDATRSTSPGGAGFAVTEDQLRLAANRRLTQKFAVFVGVRGIRYTPLDTAIETVPTQTYLVGRTGFEWRMRRWLSLVGAYNYTNGKNTGGPAADVNQVSLTIVYEPNRLENGPAITVGY